MNPTQFLYKHPHPITPTPSSITQNLLTTNLFFSYKHFNLNSLFTSKTHLKMAPQITTAAEPTELAKAGSMPSRAYVTFLAGNGDYVKGVVGLVKGLRKVKSKYPLVVAILPDVPEDHREILVSQGCIVKEIEPVYPPENQTQFAMAYYVINYSKLRIWEV